MHRGRNALRIMLHSLKPEVHREVFPASEATEFLNVAILIVTHSFLDDLLRLAGETCLNARYRLNHSGGDLLT